MTRYIDTRPVVELQDHPAITEPCGVLTCEEQIEVDSDQLHGEQTIRYGISRPIEEPTALIINPGAWSDYSARGFQQMRTGAQAKYSGAMVASLDFPGIGNKIGSSDRLTEKQKEEQKKGRMTDLSRNYWDVLGRSGYLKDSEGKPRPLVLWLNSMANLVGTEMILTAPAENPIVDISLSESVSFEETTVPKLVRDFPTKGAVDLPLYQSMNSYLPEYEGDGGIMGLVGRTGRHLIRSLRPIFALAQGKQLDILDEAIESGKLGPQSPGDEGTRIAVIAAEHGLTGYHGVDLARSLIRSKGLLSRPEWLLGEYHGWQDSIPAVLEQMSRLSIMQS